MRIRGSDPGGRGPATNYAQSSWSAPLRRSSRLLIAVLATGTWSAHLGHEETIVPGTVRTFEEQ